MTKNSMDLLELLRKRGRDGDVDFLGEALLVLEDEPDECFAVEAYLPGGSHPPDAVGTMTIVDDDQPGAGRRRPHATPPGKPTEVNARGIATRMPRAFSSPEVQSADYQLGQLRRNAIITTAPVAPLAWIVQNGSQWSFWKDKSQLK